MVELSKDVLSTLLPHFSSIWDNKAEKKSKREVILFFSYDIVNSSLFKTINYYGWSTVITELLKSLQKRVEENIDNVELWRILGDEAIFIVHIRHIADVFDCIDKIFSIMNNTISDLKNGVFFENSDQSTYDSELMKLQNVLSLKSAAWIAIVATGGVAHTAEYENIFTKYQPKPKNEIYEFLGNDIDAGFRISKQSAERRLVLSFELAYLLSEKTEYLSRIHIITYKKLDGIWKQRLYPIIWYHNNNLSNGVCFEDSFYYDERQAECLSYEYFENHKANNLGLESYMFTDNHYAFGKLLKDIGLSNKINKIKENIPNQDSCDRLVNNQSLLELHCAAVCYDENSQSILIFKRSLDRTLNGGAWEFGCAKASLTHELTESIKLEYKQDFNLEVKPVTDASRKDAQPMPIAIYQVEKKNGLHKGVICLAKIIGNYEINEFRPTAKHDAVRWITEDQIENFSEKSIPDFKQTLQQAFNMIKKFKNDGGNIGTNK